MKNNQAKKYLGGLIVSLVAAIFTPSLLGWQAAQATPADVAPVPIFTSTTATTEVKPNVMFVLDDSGSMAWGYMPDAAENFAGRLGFANAHCNGVYYNPNITYTPPVTAAGVSYPDASFTGAWVNGYDTGAGTVNLSSNFNINNNFSVNDSSYVNEAGFYYVYSGAQTTEKQKDYINTNSVFYKECNSATTSTTKVDGVNPVNTLFTRKTVSSTSGPSGTDERKNFANWYSYYRTRMLMMKTASGQAFSSMNNHFRIGFFTINNNVNSDLLNIADFDSAQKASWYDKLYNSVPNNSTPLRTALSNAGKLYAGKISTLNDVTVTNPVQYSCQQNYTILSTDGYWNGGGGTKLDNGAMDNQDGYLARYYNDGATGTVTTVTPYVSTEDRKLATTGVATIKTYSKTNKAIGAVCTVSSGFTTLPTNTASAPMNVGNSRQGGLGIKTGTSPNASQCYSLGNNAWFCRNNSNGGSLPSPATSSTVTDGSGKAWYLVSNGLPKTGCVSASTAFGSGYSTSRGVCPAVVTPAVMGKQVTSTPYTQTQTLSGGTTTQIDKYTATQTRTQVVTNGVAGALGALTPTPAVFTYTSNISSASTPNDSDVTSAWSAGTATTSCISDASLPAAGDTVAVLTSTNTSTGTTSTTVVNSSGPTEGTPTVTTSTTGGTSDTLADTAAYYYNTNLRTSLLGNCTGPIIPPATTPTNLCLANKVPSNGLDTATHQHMTTFTLGLGARGRMVFSSTYLTDTTGDFFDVWKGNTKGATNCSWSDSLTASGGVCNWPVPSSNSVANIDDLWHAAVNGHGNYFSATDPNTLRNALASSLNVIINTPQPGTAAAAATTNPKVTQNNNFQFSSYFKSVEWSGELIKQTINLSTGAVPFYDHLHPNPATYDWSAQTKLDAKVASTRQIYTKGSTGLINFTWASLNSAGLQGNFTAPHITTSPPAFPTALTGLSQFCATGVDCISSTAQTNTTVATGGAAGEALVNFIRGDRTNEEGAVTDPAKFFRSRAHVLGDIVSAQPQYVGPPEKTYDEALNPGYAAFKSSYASRDAVVYAAANDGMLHAFDALSGEEKWAYIPSFVLPKLYTLADKNYTNKHQYFVEGTPKVSDVYINGTWKTILVGGLNGGGTGFYALNITDPANPTLLWEYTNDNMGYSFGNPEITKLDDANGTTNFGTWVVLLTSGYNNCPSSTTNCIKNSVGDGKGHLYVLNAATGALVSTSADISTGEGTTTDPSGLAKIFAQTPSGNKNNVTQRVYGGDLKGNLWRFTIGTGGYSKQRLATFKDSSGNPQPITSRPQVTTYNGKPIVYVGTGRYLGTSDVPSTQRQSFYAIKDELGTTDYGNPRLDTTNFIRKTAVDGLCPTGAPIDICDANTKVRTVTQENGVATDSLNNTKGWLVDFPVNSGEINFTDSKLALGTLVFSTSVPKASTSEVCGEATSEEPVSFGYMLNFLTGGAVGTDAVIGATLGVGIATAPQLIQLPDGRIVAKYRLSDGQEIPTKVRIDPPGTEPGRVSWREILAD